MDFAFDDKTEKLRTELLDFMETHVYPAEAAVEEQRADTPQWTTPPLMEDLKAEARARGLWNLFLPHKTEWTEGLSNTDYAPLAEIMGRSPLASEATNCSAPGGPPVDPTPPTSFCAALLWTAMILILIGSALLVLGCVIANGAPQAGFVLQIIGLITPRAKRPKKRKESKPSTTVRSERPHLDLVEPSPA